MFESVGIIFLSYFIGCLSTVVIVLLGFIYYGRKLSQTHPAVDQEQFVPCHSMNDNDRLKNSTIEMINCLVQYLFQELKDTARIRRFILKKLLIEFDDIKKTQIGQIFLRDIALDSFSTGRGCPRFTDMQLERYVRDERKLIKNVVAHVNVDYKDGFAMTLDVKLIFNYHCRLFIKVKHVQGRLRLEFRREPFSHWLAVFQGDPKIDLDIKSYVFSRENRQVAHLILNHIRRIIRRKQTWPSYKLRYQPFFPSTKHPLFPEILCPNAEKLIPGRFLLAIKSCDRFTIPFDVIQKNEYPLMISLDISEENCEDFLRIDRNLWWKKEMIVRKNRRGLIVREMLFINRKEFLIEEFKSIPEDLDEKERMIRALKDENLFLMEINQQQLTSIEQIRNLLDGNEEQVRIVVGIPRLHCIQVPRSIHFAHTTTSTTTADINKNSSSDTTVVLMMNDEIIPKARSTHPYSPSSMEMEIKSSSSNMFDDREFKFPIGGTNKRFVNVCLWCEPRLDFDVPNLDKKHVLLGHASASLPQIVSDAQMSFNRETNVQLHFRSIYSDYPVDPASKLTELSTHKGYDRNLIHGYVTIQIRHEPEYEMVFDEDSSVQNDTNNELNMHSETNVSSKLGLRRREKRKRNISRTSSPTKMPKLDHSTYNSSRLSNIATSAYTKLRELKRRRSLKKARNSTDWTAHEDISETDLQDMLSKCLSEDNFDDKSLEEFVHEKSLDHSMAYAKGDEFSDELFGDLTPEERRHNLETKIYYLQQEIDLQNEIRDDIIIEFNDHLTDEHARKTIQAKLDNTDEKLQALYALTLFYCSGLKKSHLKTK